MTERLTGGPDEWTEWKDAWRQVGESSDDAVADASVLEQLRHGRRTMAVAKGIQAALALGALLLLASALRHAANTVEMTLGTLVAFAIVVVWATNWSTRRSEYLALTASAAECLDAIRMVRRREIRLARFVWTILGLEMLFLSVWWAGGVEPHRHDIWSAIAIATLWIPIAAIVALAAWSSRLYRRAQAELKRAERVQREFAGEV